MSLITAPVGNGCANQKQDVRTVEFLLNRVLNQIYPPTASVQNGRLVFENVLTAIPIDGRIDPVLVQTIKDYQRNVLGFQYPDGRVDPGLNTITALARSFAQQGGVILLGPAEAARAVNPKARYNRKNGAIYQTGVFKSGQVVAGLDGSRLILNIDAQETVFLLLDKAGPGDEIAEMNPMRGRVLGVYRQSTEAFLDERDSMFFHDLSRRLQGVRALVELELGILVAVVSGANLAGFALVLGASGLNFIVENHQNFPKWASAVTAVLNARGILKTRAPKLYAKLCEGIFVGVKRGTLAAIGLAGDDVIGNVPSSMVRDPMTVGKLLGALLVGLGKASLAKRLTVMGIVFSILKTLAGKALGGVPGAIGLTVQEKTRAAADIVAQLRATGVLITDAEARAIVEEVERNAREIRAALDDLARAFEGF